MNSSTAMVVRRDHFDYEMLMVVAGFLAGYTANTLMAYQQDLRVFVSWCQTRELPLLEVRRAHIELFARSQETAGMARATIARRLSTVASFYRYCVEEELIGLSNTRDHALACLLALNGLRVSEALGADIGLVTSVWSGATTH